MAPKILVVDDDPAISEMLTIVLESEGLKPIPVMDGNDAVPAFEQHEPDLILLDLMLPGMNGVDICRAIRRESSVPIVMLTAKTDTVDVVLGLESGADDYITKPFKPKELIARIRARLRRTDGTELNLTPLEFDLLLEMARRPGQVHTRESLLESVWGYRNASDTRLVNVHVQRLRAKIEHDPEDPQIVLTVRGVGYKTGKAGAGE